MLVEKLVNAFGVSGYEKEVRNVIKENADEQRIG